MLRPTPERPWAVRTKVSPVRREQRTAFPQGRSRRQRESKPEELAFHFWPEPAKAQPGSRPPEFCCQPARREFRRALGSGRRRDSLRRGFRLRFRRSRRTGGHEDARAAHHLRQERSRFRRRGPPEREGRRVRQGGSGATVLVSSKPLAANRRPRHDLGSFGMRINPEVAASGLGGGRRGVLLFHIVRARRGSRRGQSGGGRSNRLSPICPTGVDAGFSAGLAGSGIGAATGSFTGGNGSAFAIGAEAAGFSSADALFLRVAAPGKGPDATASGGKEVVPSGLTSGPVAADTSEPAEPQASWRRNPSPMVFRRRAAEARG